MYPSHLSRPSSSSSSTTSHQSSPATSPSPMSDDDDSPAANFNGDTNKTTSYPPTEAKPSSSASPSRSPSSSPSPSQLQPSTHQLPPPPQMSRTPPVFPAREDCWTESATHTLIEAWGSHFIELNRGNLRQKHWQEVADAVNALHAHTKKQHRTDIQCKNRIDTLKKKYKIEKNQTLQSNGRYVSTWPFFNGLDALIGDTFLKNSLTLSVSPTPITTPARATTQYRKSSPLPIQEWKTPLPLLPPPLAVPVGPRTKRPLSEEVLSKRNYSAMAAAAAREKVEEEDEDDGEEEDEESETSGGAGGGSGRNRVAHGFKRLADAVGRFADIYERVEVEKQRQMVELEKQRMQCATELEIQRMKLFMESQVQLEKFKRMKRNSSNDGYS